MTPDGRRVVSASDDNTLKVWDLEQGALLATLAGPWRRVCAVAVTPDGRRVVSGSYDRTLDSGTWQRAASSQSSRAMRLFSCCAVTPDGRFVVAGDGAGQIHVLEILL